MVARHRVKFHPLERTTRLSRITRNFICKNREFLLQNKRLTVLASVVPMDFSGSTMCGATHLSKIPGLSKTVSDIFLRLVKAMLQLLLTKQCTSLEAERKRVPTLEIWQPSEFRLVGGTLSRTWVHPHLRDLGIA